jgi:iron complex outermembrane recepter protein
MLAFVLSAVLAVAAPSNSTPARPAAPPPVRALSGRVVDPTGAPLPGARVSLIEADRRAITDADGRYTLADVPVGTYGVSFAAIGYAPLVRRVRIGGEDVTLDVTLQPSLVELAPLQVTASPIATTSLESPQPVAVLGGGDLQAAKAASLGATISALPGVRNYSTGSGIGKPVIRGLSSNRVLVLADGQRLESQQWGDEHGPNIEAGDADRVEVIRGPASVLYGSDAIGGVVNVVTRPLPDAVGRPTFVGGSAEGAYSTNARQPDGAFMVEGASGAVGFRALASGRTSDDIRTPTGPLANSGNRALNGTGALGYKGGWGSVTATYGRRDERIEIHEDPAEEPDATPFQRIGNDRARLDLHLPVGASHLDVDVGYERNQRREFEAEGATDVALGLLSHTWTADVRLHHPPIGRLGGIVGVQAMHNDFQKFGEESLIPNNAYDNAGIFAFEQIESGRFDFTFGARYDYRQLDVESDEALGVVAQRRTYNSVTGNLGVLYHVSTPVALVFNVGRGFRAPTAFDLFSNGVHEGTVRFERGDSTLANETSFNTDLAVRVQTGAVSAEVGVFANFIDGFIYPNPTGVDDPASGFQIFDISQGNAHLAGFEAAVEYHPAAFLHLRGTADYVRGQNTTTDQPLAFIPPLRATYSVRVEGARKVWLHDTYVSIGGETNARQRRLDPEDFAPAGYTLVHLGAGFTLPAGGRDIAVDFQLRNAFDTAYADFLSRYKTYALDPGRNFVVRVSTAI